MTSNGHVATLATRPPPAPAAGAVPGAAQLKYYGASTDADNSHQACYMRWTACLELAAARTCVKDLAALPKRRMVGL